MKFSRSTLVLIVAPLWGLACGCDDGPSTSPGPGDTTAPGIAAVTAVDVRHLLVAFTEIVREGTAERPDNYRIVVSTRGETAPSRAAQELPVSSAVLEADGKTVLLTTAMQEQVNYDCYVRGVEDLAGNRISAEVRASFTGTTALDTTAPTVHSRAPAAGATSVPTGGTVLVQFSESMDYSSVLAAFAWTSGTGAVAWNAESDGAATFAFTPTQPLARNTVYTASVGGEAMDLSGNHLESTTWTFLTTSHIDDVAPTLVSSTPAHGATRVPRTTNIAMTFSEPLNRSLDQILLSPPPGDGVLEWSTDGRTFTFDPYADLPADTQYSLLIPPGGVEDLAGNGNVDVISVNFTTGTSFANGSFAGTVAGAAFSGPASDPMGAIVVAADRPLFDADEFGIAGYDIAGRDGGYRIERLPDGTYWPFAIKETNDDGHLNPEQGDAIGVYGVDFASQSVEPDSVTIIAGGDVTGIDFAFFDPVALSGSVVYEGKRYARCCYSFFVGVFDTTGFDPGNPLASEPLYGTEGGIPDYPQWYINQFEQGLQPGTYYIGAFMDANFNRSPDAGDPMALWESAGVPVPLTLVNGSDVLDIDFRLQDPPAGLARHTRTAPWPTAPAAETLQVRALRRAVAVLRELDQEKRTKPAP